MIISRAPLRVSFLGGGSDFPAHFRTQGGAVLATAINKYVYVTVAPLAGSFHGCRYKLAYRKVETVSDLAAIKHPAMREVIRLACPQRELELHHIADLPAGTGLGSSSSFVVAARQALAGFEHQFVSTERLARDAIQIERVTLAEPGGYQDQILAAYGGFNLISFTGETGFAVQRIPLAAARIQEIESHCLLLYTGTTRPSGQVIADQTQGCAAADQTRCLCRLADLAREGAAYLASERAILEFGRYLHEGWLLKQRLGAVSLPEVDRLYETARHLGATGGKLLGAGRGGFLLIWAPPGQHAAIAQAAAPMIPLRIQVAAPGATVIHAHD